MKIKMLRDEVVSFGPQRLFAGEIRDDLPDDVAISLIGRGYAVEVKSPAPKAEKAAVPPPSSSVKPEAAPAVTSKVKKAKG